MPRQRNSKNFAITHRNHRPATPLRQSERLLQQKSLEPNTPNPKPKINHQYSLQNDPKEPTQSNKSSIICAVSASGSGKFPSLRNGADGVSSLRRSSRISLLENANKIGNQSGHDKSKKSCDSKSNKFTKSASARFGDDKFKDNNGVLSNKVKGEVGADSSMGLVNSSERSRNHRLATPLCRSEGLLQQKPLEPNTPNLKPKNNRQYSPQNDHPKKPTQSNKRSIVCAVSAPGPGKFPSLRNGTDGISSLRRSSRLSLLENANKIGYKSGHKKSKKSSDSKSNKFSKSASTRSAGDKFKDNNGLSNKVRGEVVLYSSKGVVNRSERRTKRNGVCVEVVIGLSAAKVKERCVCKRGEEIRVNRKRKRGEETDKGRAQGWTKEQEMALQRAYFAAKPTPDFWKKVAKLVPGKSAQECFDKVHSDHITPPHSLPQSRVKKANSSSLECSSLSASKLLNPCGLNIKRLSCNKQKSHLARRTVRELLQKHNRIDQDYEADFFSVLEPNINPSTLDSQLNVVPSTPKNLQEKQGFIQKCHERSSSCRKRPLSRFSSSHGMDLVSPPVLKQVNNRALHEKYIDQLHYREAKRKAALVQAGKSIRGKVNRGPINILKIDMARAAKNALVSDLNDAINKLQHLQANALDNSSNLDDDDAYNDDIEGEDGL